MSYHYLSNGRQVYEFTITDEVAVVSLAGTSIETMTLEAARAEYRRLVKVEGLRPTDSEEYSIALEQYIERKAEAGYEAMLDRKASMDDPRGW